MCNKVQSLYRLIIKEARCFLSHLSQEGKTGTLDKGSLQDTTFFFSSALKENIQRRARMAELSDKGLALREIRWLCEYWLLRRHSCFKTPQKFSVKWELNSKRTCAYSNITYQVPWQKPLWSRRHLKTVIRLSSLEVFNLLLFGLLLSFIAFNQFHVSQICLTHIRLRQKNNS